MCVYIYIYIYVYTCIHTYMHILPMVGVKGVPGISHCITTSLHRYSRVATQRPLSQAPQSSCARQELRLSNRIRRGRERDTVSLQSGGTACLILLVYCRLSSDMANKVTDYSDPCQEETRIKQTRPH